MAPVSYFRGRVPSRAKAASSPANTSPGTAIESENALADISGNRCSGKRR